MAEPHARPAAQPPAVRLQENLVSLWVERKEGDRRIITMAQGGDFLLPMFVIGIVAALLSVNIIAANPGHRRSYTEFVVQQIAKGLEQYRGDHGSYPDAGDWRHALVAGGYVAKVPNDAWDRPLLYESTGGSYRLVSLGADGNFGGRDEDADIIQLSPVQHQP